MTVLTVLMVFLFLAVAENSSKAARAANAAQALLEETVTPGITARRRRLEAETRAATAAASARRRQQHPDLYAFLGNLVMVLYFVYMAACGALIYGALWWLFG